MLRWDAGSCAPAFSQVLGKSGAFPGLSGKESTCNAGDAGDVGLILGSKDVLEEGMATHSGILAWEIP